MNIQTNHATQAVMPPASEKEIGWPLLLGAAAAGLALSLVVLPAWVPNLAASLSGSVFWYLSRATAIASYAILWSSMAWGLMITSRMARTWPGIPAANELHKFVSLLGLALALFHGLLLIGDSYLNTSLLQVLAPFAMTAYRPGWVGLGQLSFYLWGLVLISYYVRKAISKPVWRGVHYLTFGVYAMALLHGILSGTDSALPWMQIVYWVSGGILLFLLTYRIIARAFEGSAAE